ncbi:hypothetical protein ACLOJK_007346 [Asimina triloba]
MQMGSGSTPREDDDGQIWAERVLLMDDLLVIGRTGALLVDGPDAGDGRTLQALADGPRGCWTLRDRATMSRRPRQTGNGAGARVWVGDEQIGSDAGDDPGVGGEDDELMGYRTRGAVRRWQVGDERQIGRQKGWGGWTAANDAAAEAGTGADSVRDGGDSYRFCCHCWRTVAIEARSALEDATIHKWLPLGHPWIPQEYFSSIYCSLFLALHIIAVESQSFSFSLVCSLLQDGLVRRFIRDEDGVHFDHPSPSYDRKDFVPLEVKAGSLVVLHGDLVHQR